MYPTEKEFGGYVKVSEVFVYSTYCLRLTPICIILILEGTLDT